MPQREIGAVTLVLILTAFEAAAQVIVVEPANPVIANGATVQFTATGNITPRLVSASGSHTCALLPDSTVRCWGYNEYGQLGNGTRTDSVAPVRVTGISNASAVSSGHHHTCALLTDGTVRCWGRNEFGELGDGSTCLTPPCATPLPVKVTGISNAIAVSSGAYHTCARLANGGVRCWGLNEFGQLGNGTFTNSSTPVAVSGATGAVAVTAGGYHTCALRPDGSVQCWGRNEFGELGDGSTSNWSAPVFVWGLTDAVAVNAGGYHTCALVVDGTLRCWGLNNFGQLGDGSSLTYPFTDDFLATSQLFFSTLPPGSHSRTPVTVRDISSATAVAAGGFHTCASLSDGSTSCWGQNDYGQLGDGTYSSSSTPTAVFGLPPDGTVSTAAWHTCALQPDTSVWCWGRNFAGQVGDGSHTDASAPVAVRGSGTVRWTSSNPAVATIDPATGLARAVGPGSTTITATANSVSGSTVLTVVN